MTIIIDSSAIWTLLKIELGLLIVVAIVSLGMRWWIERD